MERRRHERHDLSSPVIFVWGNSDACRGVGVTRDFSAGGLFVFTEDLPTVGTSLQFAVNLAVPEGGPGLIVRGKGQVKRVEIADSMGRRGGFAATTGRMKLEKA